MLELINYDQEILNTKDQITIDYLKEGQEFLQKFELNQKILLDTTSLLYRFLRINRKVPHNIFKFYIAAYYIASRHPWSFPVHESKKRFCRRFGIEQSSLEYSVEKIVSILKLVKIIDDKNFPYYIDLQTDIGYNLSKKIAKNEVDKVMMKFLLYHQAINSQILAEDLVNKLIFELKVFPEELFRQFYEIIFELVEYYLRDYNDFANLQEKYFV